MATTAAPRAALSRRQRVGVVTAGLLSLAALPSALYSTPDGEVGPPLDITVLDSLLGLVGLIAVVPAWRGSGVARRILAGVLVLNALTAFPAFFVDVPAGLKVFVGLSVLVTIGVVTLLFAPSGDAAASG